MAIDLDDSSYIVGMWFSSNPKTNDDWLACVVRDPQIPTRFKGWSRFRKTMDEKIWDSKDEKKWTRFLSRECHTEQNMIDAMNGLQQHLKCIYIETDEIIVNGDLKKLMELAKHKSWMNFKKEKV